jgi:hypothetical protein
MWDGAAHAPNWYNRRTRPETASTQTRWFNDSRSLYCEEHFPASSASLLVNSSCTNSQTIALTITPYLKVIGMILDPPDTATAIENPNDERQEAKSQRVKVAAAVVLIIVSLTAVGIWSLNYFAADRPLQHVLTDNAANRVVKASAHLGGWIAPKTLVFNLTEVTGEASRLDVFRVFLQYADAMKDRQFDKVILAARGTEKFQIDGSYFRQLGQEYDTQNPVYTIRTFPTHLEPLDGGNHFAEYDGGIIAVVTAEMDQFSQFSDRWYVNAFASTTASKSDPHEPQSADHASGTSAADVPAAQTAQEPTTAWDTSTQVNPVSGETTIYAHAGYGDQHHNRSAKGKEA